MYFNGAQVWNSQILCISVLYSQTVHRGYSNVFVKYEPVHEISNNVVCATSKASDQPAHTRSLFRGFASRLSIL